MSKVVFYSFWCAVLLMPVAAAMMPAVWQKLDHLDSASVIAEDNPLVISDSHGALPVILTAKDISLYNDIFSAQKRADWKEADAAIAQLNNPLLMGYVLAERYLDRHYNATADELADWLDKNNDHPQAADIYTVALSKDPSLKYDVPQVSKKATLVGYGDDNGLVAVNAAETPYNKVWQAGLAAWKSGHKDVAAKYFASMTHYEMSPWMQSAANFWAYRSYRAIGNQTEAQHYLEVAAQHPRSFYGVLARKQLNQDLGLDHKPVELTDSDVLEMIGDPSIRRVVALVQAGFNERAEKELRAHFPQSDDEEKPRLLALAHELGLASVQISMAKQLHTGEHELDFARYPTPNWRPEGGFKIDPLLLYSLMRQESGFRPSAVSSGGALGLMQLMPQTASFMQKQITDDSVRKLTDNVSDPVSNITLGQNYVEHLLNNELVEGNLFYLLAAYNAGPGRLQEWKSHTSANADPLLFVESIPFSQTRNYVMQVMTNYWIYSELEGTENNSIYAVLKGHWPTYEQYSGSLAAKSVSSANGNS